jgi:competence protein ComEC
LGIGEPRVDSVWFKTGESVWVEGRVRRVETKYAGAAVILDQVLVGGERVSDRVLVQVPEFSEPPVGAVVGLKCGLKRPEPFDGFRYDKFLAAKHIRATCRTYGPLEVVSEGVVEPVRAVVAGIHGVVRGRINQVLPEPQATLLAGLLMGDDDFSPVWSARFRTVGVSHIVAASGSNIALVAQLSMTGLFSLGILRQRAFVCVLVMIFGFVLLAGGESAVTRAAVMAALTLMARDLGRATSIRNIFLLTVTILILESPLRLRYDPGFQLSALATLGLLILAKPISTHLGFLPERFAIREAVSTTLAATVATLPITIWSFGQLSLVSVLANGLILPLLPLAMGLGVVSLIHPWFAMPARMVLDVILALVTTLADLPYASVEV